MTKRENNARWRSEHKDYHAQYYAAHKAGISTYERARVAACADRIRVVREAYLQAHKAERAAYVRNYYLRNPGRAHARAMKRYAAKLQATPPWLTAQHLSDIEKFYVEAARLQATDGIKRHVDHIYPLQGRTVCGLHVPWNLQILIAVENRKKGNRILSHDRPCATV